RTDKAASLLFFEINCTVRLYPAGLPVIKTNDPETQFIITALFRVHCFLDFLLYPFTVVRVDVLRKNIKRDHFIWRYPIYLPTFFRPVYLSCFWGIVPRT